MNDSALNRSDEEQGRGRATGANRKGNEANAAYVFLAPLAIKTN